MHSWLAQRQPSVPFLTFYTAETCCGSDFEKMGSRNVSFRRFCLCEDTVLVCEVVQFLLTNIPENSSNLKMEASGSSETLARQYWNTQCHITENGRPKLSSVKCTYIYGSKEYTMKLGSASLFLGKLNLSIRPRAEGVYVVTHPSACVRRNGAITAGVCSVQKWRVLDNNKGFEWQGGTLLRADIQGGARYVWPI
jgi:hypothetical protein